MVVFSSGQTVDQLNKIQTIDVESRFSGWLGVFINGMVVDTITEIDSSLSSLTSYIRCNYLNCFLADDSHKVLGVEIRGTDTSVRVRQIKVLGTVSGECLAYGRQYSYSTIQHRQCENETLKVFRSITFQVRHREKLQKTINTTKLLFPPTVLQVFGKLIQGKVTSMDSSVEESKDLKEHMVGILFSQSKLTHLQKQVKRFFMLVNST